MAKQPWQTTKKKSLRDMEREMERAQERRISDMAREKQEEKSRKYRRLGIFSLGMGLILYLFSGALFGANQNLSAGDTLLMQYFGLALFIFSGVNWILHAKNMVKPDKFYYVMGVFFIIMAILIGIYDALLPQG